MKYAIEQKDLDILFQPQKELYMKLEVIKRSNMKIVDNIEGLLISDSLSIDAESNVRRTYSCELFLTDDSNLIAYSTDWMKYYIRPYIGIKYTRTDEIIWYQLGTFCLTDSNYSYDTTTHTLNASFEDLMCLLNGELNGKLKDLKIKITADSDMRDSIIALLTECGISKYYICDLNNTIPYDIEFSNTTYYDILNDIISLYSGYEMYFDIDGIFIIQKIPDCSSDDNILDDTIIQPLLINDNGSSSFQGIFNHIKVYGMEIETQRYTETCTYSNNVYYAIMDDIENSYMDGYIYSIMIPIENESNVKLSINSMSSIKICDSDYNTIAENTLKSGYVYSFRYMQDSQCFILMGNYQCFGEAYDDNPDSPFSIDNLGYEICDVRQGDDYEKIYTDDLCVKRAKYEIYLATQLKNDLSLEMIFIPWLDVNTKIEYTSKNWKNTYSYIIKSISGSISSCTMSVGMIRFYENYSYL